MLFYERRKKKPIKILVPEDKVEEAKRAGIEVHHDEEKKEYYKYVPYHHGTDNEPPNEIWNQVSEDNGKFTFETDVYSESFFNFIKSVLQSVADIKNQGDDHSEVRECAIKISHKSLFSILARCKFNDGMK